METFAAAVTLFLIMDPLGNIPIFLSVLSGVVPERRRRILIRELLIALAIMLLFLFTGPTILTVLGLSREAISIGGGLVLMIIAIRMIFPSRGGVMGDDGSEGEPLIVPLAMPLIAGPSVLATLVLLAETGPDRSGDRVDGCLDADCGHTVAVTATLQTARRPWPESHRAPDGHDSGDHLGANAAGWFQKLPGLIRLSPT